MLASSERVALARTALRDVLAALFCALFAFVYEQFSHGVWSAAMVFAFVWPLLGALPYLIALAGRRDFQIADGVSLLWHCGLASLTVGSLMNGALEIYGTTHPLLVVYPLAGGTLCAGAAVLQLMKQRHSARQA